MRHAPLAVQPVATTAERYGRIKAKRLRILNLGLFTRGDRGVPPISWRRGRAARQERCGRGHAARSSGRARRSWPLAPWLAAVGHRHRRSKTRLPPVPHRAALPAEPAKASLVSASPIRSRQIRRWEEGILASSASASALMRRSAVAAFDSAYLDHAERRQMELSAGSFGATEIMREQIALWPLLELADGSDQEPHSYSPSGGQPSIRSPAAP